MKRQCAWCLRLMNDVGEHISATPLPKFYDATHGICGVCGTRWMEQAMVVMGTQDTTDIFLQLRAKTIENLKHSATECNTQVGTR